MYFNKKDAIDEHRKMWNWIANISEKEQRFATKEEYIKEKGYEKFHIKANCFCCAYNSSFNADDCLHCPLIWYERQVKEKDDTCFCMSEFSPFIIYFNALGYNLSSSFKKVTIEEYVEAARKIANLKEVTFNGERF